VCSCVCVRACVYMCVCVLDSRFCACVCVCVCVNTIGYSVLCLLHFCVYLSTCVRARVHVNVRVCDAERVANTLYGCMRLSWCIVE